MTLSLESLIALLHKLKMEHGSSLPVLIMYEHYSEMGNAGTESIKEVEYREQLGSEPEGIYIKI